MTAGGLGLRLRPVDRGVPQRQRDPRHGHVAGSGSSTTRSCCCSTPTTSRSTSPCRRRSTPRPGAGGRHRRRRRPTATDRRPASTVTVAGKGMVVLQALPARRPDAGARRSRADDHGPVPMRVDPPSPAPTSSAGPGAAPDPETPAEPAAAPPADDGNVPRTLTRDAAVADVRDSPLDLPAADHAGLRPAARPRPTRRTCTPSASTGSTCRRCCAAEPGPTTATT